MPAGVTDPGYKTIGVAGLCEAGEHCPAGVTDPGYKTIGVAGEHCPAGVTVPGYKMTIAQGIGWIAILALNIGLVGAILVEETGYGLILIAAALTFGFWRLRHCRDRARSFWLGFELGGLSSVLAAFACEAFPGSALNRLLGAYINFIANLAFSHFSDPMVDLIDDHWVLFLAVVNFAPQLMAALLGGVIGAFMGRKRRCLSRRGWRSEYVLISPSSRLFWLRIRSQPT